MEAHKDSIENEINDLIDKLISGLNERRERLLSILRIKRVELREIQATDKQVERQLIETRAALVSKKIHNKLQTLHKRILNEVDEKFSEYIQPSKELRFKGNSQHLESQIASLGEITVQEFYFLPLVPQQAATPDASSKPDKDQPPSVRRDEFENRTPKPSPRHVTNPKEYLCGMSLSCETLLETAKREEFIPRHLPQRAVTPDVSINPVIDDFALVRRLEYENIQPKTSRSCVTEDPMHHLWGKMTRKDCEDILLQRAKQGEFIVRYSGSREGELVLSMRNQYKIHHFNIQQKDGWLRIGEIRVRSVSEIISHFKMTPIASYQEYGDKLTKIFLSQALQKD